jgi:dephospho-CoA kinase
MVVVGLTGGIGSGKSTVSRMLSELGAVVIDADQVAREVVEPHEPAFALVVERFGPGVVGADGRLDRPALGAIVFRDPKARADLETITHPAIGLRMAERMAAEAGTDHVVVLDVPLLVESGRTNTAGVIVVDCPEELAIERLQRDRGMDADEIRLRMAAQATRQQRLDKADFVIVNDGSQERLREQVEAAWAWIGTLPRTGRSPGA